MHPHPGFAFVRVSVLSHGTKLDVQYVQVQQMHHWALTTLPLLHPGILHMFLAVSSPQDGS